MAKSPKPHDTAGQAEGGNRRDFLYVATGTLGAVGVAAASWPFIHQMNPSLPQSHFLHLLVLILGHLLNHSTSQHQYILPCFF